MKPSQKIMREAARKPVDAILKGSRPALYGATKIQHTPKTQHRAKSSMSPQDHVGGATSTAQVPYMAPKQSVSSSLDTSKGRVVIPENGELPSFPVEASDASLRGRTMTLLNDNKPKTPVELEMLRAGIMDDFHKMCTTFEKLHEVFNNAAAFFEKHETLRHPPIFYVGHTASFYVNKLHLGKFSQVRIDPVLEMQMAVGVDEMSWDDLDSNKYVWPSGAEARADPVNAAAFLQKVMDFRRDVREHVHKVAMEQPMEWPIKKDSFWYVIAMGIEHDRIHLETSSCILRQAPLDVVQSSEMWPRCPHGRFHTDPNSSVAKSTPKNSLVPIKDGTTRLGRSWEGTSTYGWDNEFGTEKHIDVPAFSASKFLVTNKDFLDFVEAGGYSAEKYWTKEGWSWVSDMKPTAPRFWRQYSSGFHLRTFTEEVVMPWDWPAEVNHHESAAYCKYLSETTGRTVRLPSETEYLRIRDSEPTDLQNSAHGPRWTEAPGNVNLAHWASPCPVDTFASPAGIYDVLGNVWQHNLTPFDVLDGFTTHPLYEDFTTPCVSSHHSRIMGGSWISTGANGGTRDSRFAFRRHFYQHAGFRYVESDADVVTEVAPYERDQILCKMYRFHFDKPSFGENYPEGLAGACANAMEQLGMPLNTAKAMELGCGAGRTVLELAQRGIGSVHGADMNAKSFQQTVQRLLQNVRLRWVNTTEGDFVDMRDLTTTELGLTSGKDLDVHWHQIPDFAAIDKKKFNNYDVVVCAQPGVLCASNPIGLLSSAHELLKPGGLLVIGSQYEWAAPVASTKAQSGAALVSEVLEGWFDEALPPSDLAFVQSDTARKFDCGSQHLTFWKRRSEQRKTERKLPDAEHVEASDDAPGQAKYDAQAVVGYYMDFHFGPNSDYPVACAEHCVRAMKELGVPMGRALEVGAGPGRSAIELSKVFEHVDAGDYSQSFVDVAQRLITDGEIHWSMMVDRTANTVVERSVSAKDLEVGSVSFSQMDALALPKSLTGYDLICGFNLIDRLAKPKDFLLAARQKLNPGGLLVIASPYTWQEEFTDRSEWLGAFKYGDNDGPTSYVGLKEFLGSNGFEEVREAQDVWFRIDELANGRKSQQTSAQMTFWRQIVE